MQPLVRDLLDLPAHTENGDFVVKLTDGLAKAERTVRDYVVTPSIHESFNKALRLIGECLGDGSSRAAYLHGSFGSGKSHFMAMLGLLLDGDVHAWGHAKLQDLKPEYPWTGKKKLLRVPVHMLGQPSLRDAVFDTYIATLRQERPGAPVPPLFVDEGLFEDAQNLRQRIGDEAFFGGLNEGGSTGSSNPGWGDLDSSSSWDAERFERTRGAEDIDERAALVDRLCQTYFQNWAGTGSRYVDFDRGLAALTKHAHSQGYEGVLLLLDELILWLAGRISDRQLVTREVEHTVKLVEAQHGDRAIPVIAFIARQRSLTDLVGDRTLGADTVHLEEQLSHNQGRFTVVHLEERNLPEIVSQRLLRAKDSDSKALIDRSFAGIVDQVRRDWQTLLGAHGDQDAFRKLYPFSPALIDALVAISDCLQRERTALKMLADMLIEHLGDLPLGRVVPIGDLFDLVAAGDPIDEPSLRRKFERAKEIYQQKVLPALWRTHQTGTTEKCQRRRDDYRVSLGCALCPQVACRTSNRLVKTLLLADMVPNLEAFRDLTVSRVVGLNHGVIHSPIPGQEAALAARQLREWASDIPELRVGDEADPSVRISLDAIDIEPILQRAAQADSDGSRRRILKDILFQQLGIAESREEDVTRDVLWKGTRRRCRILFGNVREMTARHFQASENDDVRIVVDYPFDDKGHEPAEDVKVVEAFVDSHPEGSHTVVWLPSFFSADVQAKLGQLTRLLHIQRNPSQYLAQLRAEDQERARHAIDNMAAQTTAKIRLALERAYGLVSLDEGDRDLDPARRLAKHFYCLMPDRTITGLVRTDFSPALEDLVDKVLHFRFPKHPHLGTKPVTNARLEKVRQAFAELREQHGESIMLQSHPAKAELVDIAIPLQLVEPTRSGVRLSPTRLDELDRARHQENLSTPTVGRMRQLLDPSQQVGLPTEVQDLLILCWAEHCDRELRSLGQPVMARIGNLENSQELHAQDLPTTQQWQRGLELARALLGHSTSRQLLTAANLRQFVDELRSRAKPLRNDVEAVPQRLRNRLQALGTEPTGARLTAAIEAVQLLNILLEGEPAQVVRALATEKLASSPTAIGKAMGGASAQRRALENDLHLEVLTKASNADDQFRDQVVAALTSDEVAVELGPRLGQLAKEAMGQLGSLAPAPKPEPGWQTLVEDSAHDADTARKLLDRAASEIDKPGDFELTLELRRRQPPRA